MAANPPIIPQESEPQRRARHRVYHLQAHVTTDGHDCARIRERLAARERHLQEKQAAHPEWATRNFHRAASFAVLVGVLAAIYLLDYYLFRSLSEFIVRLSPNVSPATVAFAIAAIPFCILNLELYVGIQRYLAAEDAADWGGDSSVIGWTVVGLILAVVMPAAAVATSLSSYIDIRDTGILRIFRVQTLALGALALASHIAVLFGGRQASRAKGWLLYVISVGSSHAIIWRLTVMARGADHSLVQSFTIYFRAYSTYNATYTPLLPAGPFDHTTITEVNRVFGRHAIMPPDGPDPGGPTGGIAVLPPPPPVEPPPQTPAPAHEQPTPTQPEPAGDVPQEPERDAETEYYRTILTQRMREDDSEVRP